VEDMPQLNITLRKAARKLSTVGSLLVRDMIDAHVYKNVNPKLLDNFVHQM